MELHFRNRKLEKACTIERESVRLWGAEQSGVVRRRIAQLAAAANLGVISTLPPPRLHPLSGQREGQFAVDVKQPFRLIFEPVGEDIPKLADGGIDKAGITAIRILDVKDYHGN